MAFLALSVVADRNGTARAARQYGLGGLVVWTKADVMSPLGAGAVPATYFVRADGTIVAHGEGALSEAVIARETERLLR